MNVEGRREYMQAQRGRRGDVKVEEWQGDRCILLKERGDIKDTKGKERGDADLEIEERVRYMHIHVCVGREACREGEKKEGTCGYGGEGEATCIYTM